jgi:hypothetical protein
VPRLRFQSNPCFRPQAGHYTTLRAAFAKALPVCNLQPAFCPARLAAAGDGRAPQIDDEHEDEDEKDDKSARLDLPGGLLLVSGNPVGIAIIQPGVDAQRLRRVNRSRPFPTLKGLNPSNPFRNLCKSRAKRGVESGLWPEPLEFV